MLYGFRRVSKWFFKLIFQTSLTATTLTFLNNSEADLACKALDVGWIADLAAVGTIKAELHILQRDGCVTFHYITRPYSMILKQAFWWGICTSLVVKNLREKRWKLNKKEDVWPTEIRLGPGCQSEERNKRQGAEEKKGAFEKNKDWRVLYTALSHLIMKKDFQIY